MKIVGITAEYNPFHHGHQYHIAESRRAAGAEGVVVIMSGDFVQRGEPAVTDKFARAAMALAGGADVVLELPAAFATASAEFFAAGAVEIMDRLHVVTDLSYGCDCRQADRIPEIAAFLCEEPPEFSLLLRQELERGKTWPQAREAVLEQLLPGSEELLASPNTILAIEYHKALLRRGSSIIPHAIPRIGSAYHEETLFPSANPSGGCPRDTSGLSFSSASAIRQALRTDPSGESIRPHVPEEVLPLLKEPVFPEDISVLLRYALLSETKAGLTGYTDMSEELAARTIALIREDRMMTFPELADAIKTRNVTRSRVNRALLHVLLHLTGVPSGPIPAVRLLGMRRGTPVMRLIQNKSAIPVVTKMADADPSWFQADCYAAEVYRTVLWEKTGLALPDDIRRSPVILD